MVARVVAVIREGWDAFARYLAADPPPPLTRLSQLAADTTAKCLI